MYVHICIYIYLYEYLYFLHTLHSLKSFSPKVIYQCQERSIRIKRNMCACQKRRIYIKKRPTKET